ncbi:MAG TPA: hypothetical protein VL501_06645, partial [Pyrinomonadaceae bacterium]|nr:hypothetical protein [Pyrinomonadaceae bacterium]
QVNAGRYAVGTFGGVLIRAETDGAKVRLLDANSSKEIATLVALDHDEWVVTTPDGRFDTNKPLDHIDGLAWILSDDPMTPRPLDLFMRQYYEPGLLRRRLSCWNIDKCKAEFKAVPDITGLNLSRTAVYLRKVQDAKLTIFGKHDK